MQKNLVIRPVKFKVIKITMGTYKPRIVVMKITQASLWCINMY